MFKLMGKKIITILRLFVLSKPMEGEGKRRCEREREERERDRRDRERERERKRPAIQYCPFGNMTPS